MNKMYRQQGFCILRSLHCDAAIRVQGHGRPIEHKLILPPYLVDVDQWHLPFQDTLPHHLTALTNLVEVVGRTIDVDHDLGASGCSLGHGVGLPQVFAYAESHAHPRNIQDQWLGTTFEVALFVKDLIVGQPLLFVGAKNATMINYRQHVVLAACLATRVTHYQTGRQCRRTNALQCMLDAAIQTGTQQEIFGRVSGQHQLRKHDHARPMLCKGLTCTLQQEVSIAVYIANQGIELGHHHGESRGGCSHVRVSPRIRPELAGLQGWIDVLD
jgi:hypothetical protein